MYCMNCGKESKDTARFCEFCGKELPLNVNAAKPKKVPIVPIIIGAGVLMLVGVGVLIGVGVSKAKAAKTAIEDTVDEEISEALGEETAEETEDLDADEPTEGAPTGETKSLAQRTMEASDEKKNEDCMDQHVAYAKELGTGTDEGKVLSDFTFLDADGKDHHITEFIGKPVYYNFFTSWCPYCGYEIPDMQKIAEEYKAQGIEVVMIDIQETSAETDPYAKENNINFPIYFMEDWTIGDWELVGVPVSIVVDKYGIIRGVKVGMSDYDWMKSTVEKAVFQ